MSTRTRTITFLRVAGIGLFLLVINKYSMAQDIVNDFQSRASVELSLKPLKHLKINLIPELRFDENFALDKYLFETEAVYKPFKMISFGVAYRFTGNLHDSKEIEYFHKYAVSAIIKKEINRFEPSFQLRYSNFADDEVVDKEFMRYKASVKYDIANCKISPFAGAEAFQQLNDSKLYKMRYTLGINYKLFKKNYIGLSYKLDYYNNELRNRHIISVGYKIKF